MRYLILGIIGFLILWVLCPDTFGHEGDGFKHLKKGETIGPHIMRAHYCPGKMTQMWEVDSNRDGVVDQCNIVIMLHNVIHYKRFAPVDGVCLCNEEKEVD